MEYTSLGRTGLTVSRLCLGCMSYGASRWQPWVLDEDAAEHGRALPVGATRIEQLESSLRAIELKLTPEEIAALDSPYTPKRVQF
jgi:aryl-alcohol dehydrogenase-like predicted oxidoreductase